MYQAEPGDLFECTLQLIRNFASRSSSAIRFGGRMLLEANLTKFSLLQHIYRNALRNCSKLSDVSDLRSIFQSPSLRIFKAFYDSKLGNYFSFRWNKSAKTLGCASQVISPTFFWKTSVTFVRFVSFWHFTCMQCMNFTFCGPNGVPPLAGLGIFEFTFQTFHWRLAFVQRAQRVALI